jgi:hypothetical protein
MVLHAIRSKAAICSEKGFAEAVELAWAGVKRKFAAY